MASPQGRGYKMPVHRSVKRLLHLPSDNARTLPYTRSQMIQWTHYKCKATCTLKKHYRRHCHYCRR